MRSHRPVLALLLGLALLGAPAAALAGKPKPPVLGPNLVVNAGFESSAIEGNPASPPGSQPQPLLPTGWQFEGLTVLFDHSPNLHHTGKRAAAISGSLSGGRQFCETGSCQENPANAVKDASATRFTLPPHWRTAAAIPVSAGKGYQLAFWGGWSTVTVGQGLDAIVRWVDAGGAIVKQQTVVKTTDGGNQAWKKFSSPRLTAPAGATGVVLLLGQTDDLWIGQVYFDDVYFGTSR
jgi:hypothetical protein